MQGHGSVTTVESLPAYESAAPWFNVRLTFADGARVDVVAVIDRGGSRSRTCAPIRRCPCRASACSPTGSRIRSWTRAAQPGSSRGRRPRTPRSPGCPRAPSPNRAGVPPGRPPVGGRALPCRAERQAAGSPPMSTAVPRQAGRDPVLAVMGATGRSRRQALRLIAGARDEGLSPAAPQPPLSERARHILRIRPISLVCCAITSFAISSIEDVVALRQGVRGHGDRPLMMGDHQLQEELVERLALRRAQLASWAAVAMPGIGARGRGRRPPSCAAVAFQPALHGADLRASGRPMIRSASRLTCVGLGAVRDEVRSSAAPGRGARSSCGRRRGRRSWVSRPERPSWPPRRRGSWPARPACPARPPRARYPPVGALT